MENQSNENALLKLHQESDFTINGLVAKDENHLKNRLFYV